MNYVQSSQERSIFKVAALSAFANQRHSDRGRWIEFGRLGVNGELRDYRWVRSLIFRNTGQVSRCWAVGAYLGHSVEIRIRDNGTGILRSEGNDRAVLNLAFECAAMLNISNDIFHRSGHTPAYPIPSHLRWSERLNYGLGRGFLSALALEAVHTG